MSELAWVRDVLFRDLDLYQSDPILNAVDPHTGEIAIVKLYRQMRGLCPNVDIVAAIREAGLYEITKRKTPAKGRLRWLARWIRTKALKGGVFANGPVTIDDKQKAVELAELDETVAGLVRTLGRMTELI